jgi:aminopeptidase N
VSWAIIPDDFESKTLPDVPGQPTKITIHGRKSELNMGLGDFALQTAVRAVNEMVAYFGIAEALPPKIDIIGLPFYPFFESPSWGLMIFREQNLFYNENFNSEVDKQLVASSVVEEIAHNVKQKFLCFYIAIN